jgi:hypothetical protein
MQTDDADDDENRASEIKNEARKKRKNSTNTKFENLYKIDN